MWLKALLAALAVPWPEYGVNQQPETELPPKQAIRPIRWGDINFIHTTDTHGWLAGHILEPEFGGDWGDLVSFAEHMRKKAADKGVDLLLVDTGDRHDGNGLSDASEVDSENSLEIFRSLDFDVVTLGNHELYRGEASLQEFHDMLSFYGERYVVSNVEIAVGRTWNQIGHKYRIFTTPALGYRVLALGFLFNFEGNDREVTRVTRVQDEIQKPWFQTLLREELPANIDYVVVAGHIPVRAADEFEALYAAIRSVRPDIPISMFGGHSHIRDYKKYDERAVALESGRYMETIGWASANLSEVGDDGQFSSVSFSRSYIDSNKQSLAFHAGVDVKGLSTDRGANISSRIAEIRDNLELDTYIANVPKTWYTDRAQFPSKNSIFSLLQDHVLAMLSSPPELLGKPRFIYLNTGAVRFDLFKGAFTKDTGYIVSPFKNQWFYIDKVPIAIARKLLPIINQEDRVVASYSRLNTWAGAVDSRADSGADSDDANAVIKGYVTIDDDGMDGDDTIHQAWEFYPIPNAFVAEDGVNSDTEEVVLVFHDFMAAFIEKALKKIGHQELFDPILHGGERIIELIPRYLNVVEYEDEE